MPFSRVSTIRRFSTALGLALLLCAATSHAQDAKQAVTVAIIPTLEAAPLLLASDKGIFTKHGLDVKVEVGASGATILPGVLSGQYDIGYANVVSDLQAIDRKLPILLVHSAYGNQTDAAKDAYKIYVGADSKIKDARQLATANIGTPYINNISEWTTKKALENLGVRDFSSLRWTKVTGADAYGSVKSGAIDAVWLAQPDGAAAEKAGLRPLLAVNATSMPGAVAGYFVTSKRYAQSHAAVLRRFNQAISEANDYMNAHPDEGRDAVIAHFHFDRSLVYAAKLNTYPNDPGVDKLRIIARDIERYGLTHSVPDVNAIFWKDAVQD